MLITAKGEMCRFISPTLFPRHLTEEKMLHTSVKTYKAEGKGQNFIDLHAKMRFNTIAYILNN